MVFHRYRWLATVRKAWISLFLSGALPAFPDLFSSGLFSFSAVPSPLFLPRSTPTPTPRLYARFSRLNFAYSIPCSLPLFSIATSRLSLFHSRRRERERAHLAPSTEQLFLFFFFFLRLRIRLPWKSNAASSLAASFFFSDYFLPFVISSLSFRRPFLSLSLARSLAFPSSVLIFASKSELQSPTKCGNC